MAKTKLTPEVQEKICEILREGNPRRTAAILAGIDERTFQRWMAAGEKGKKPFDAFVVAVKKAEEEAVRKHVAVITKAAEKNWQAAAWWLERRYPADFGKKDNIDLSLAGDVKIELAFKLPESQPEKAEKAEKMEKE